MRRRMGRRRKTRVGAALLVAVLLLTVGLLMLDARLRPLIQSYGYMTARRGAMLAVHTAMEEVLSDGENRYADLVTVERDAAGAVLSAEANVVAINRLKAAATNAVMRELSARTVQQTDIPLGNLLGGSFFTGRGPFLPVKIHTSGAVVSELVSEFSDAGINQTNHRLSLSMTVMMTAALPLERVSLELSTSFLVCETVLVGAVPQTVLQLDFGESVRNIFGAGD